jgi:DMSO/TMAO reductase YedYZ heme-binding membrane subunit
VYFRKTFGLAGYSLAALHLGLAFFNLLPEERAITFADAGSLAFAAMAFIIFTFMAITSTSSWLIKLGYENWKSLQRTGYIALLFVLFHIALLENGVILTRLIGQLVITFALVVMLLRGIVFVMGIKRKQKTKL